MVPTKKAHMILDYASKEGKQHEMQEILFRSYFSDGKNVASDDILTGLASEAGLDTDKAMAAIKNSKASDKFEEDIKESLRKGKDINYCLDTSMKLFVNITNFPRYHWCSLL